MEQKHKGIRVSACVIVRNEAEHLPRWLAGMRRVADELVVVTMPTCPPCKRLKADLLQKPDIYAGHQLRLLEGKQAMRDHNVDMVPTIIRVRDGRQVARKVGYEGPERLREWLNAR